MKIVHTADWHIGKILNDYSLLEDQRYWFSRFIDRLSEIQPDALVIAGDLYDRSIPSAEAISLLDDILRRIVLDLNIETLLIAGNHDSRERLSFGSVLLERCGLHIAGSFGSSIRKVTLHPQGETVHFYLLPYLEPHNIKPLFPGESIRTHEEAIRLYTADMLTELNTEDLNVLVAHGLFSNLRDGAEADEEIGVGGSEMVNAAAFRAFDYVALGHLHSHRNAGSERMVYAGSPLKYSTDEAGQQKSFCIVELSGKDRFSLSTETIPPLRDVRVLEGSFDELTAYVDRDNTDDYVFVNLTDRTVVLNAISRLKAVYPNAIGLRYTNMTSISADRLVKSKTTLHRMSNEELFTDFYETVTEESPDEAQRAAIVAAFAAAGAASTTGDLCPLDEDANRDFSAERGAN